MAASWVVIMFAKPAFILRSLFVAATVASLVACSFDGEQPENEKGSTSALHKDHGTDAGASTGADGGAGWGADASASADAGPYNGGADAGWSGDDDDGVDAGAGWGSAVDAGAGPSWGGTDAGF